MTRDRLRITIGTVSWILRNAGMSQEEVSEYCRDCVNTETTGTEAAIIARANFAASTYHIEKLRDEPDRVKKFGEGMGRMQYYGVNTITQEIASERAVARAAEDEAQQAKLKRLFDQGAPIQRSYIPVTMEDHELSDACSRIVAYCKQRRKLAQERLRGAQSEATQASFKCNQPRTINEWLSRKATQQSTDNPVNIIQAEIKYLQEAESSANNIKQNIHNRSRIRYYAAQP